MLNYFIRRILFTIPSLFLFSLIVFGLRYLSPGDPSLNKLYESRLDENSSLDTKIQIQKDWKKKWGLDLPAFYLSAQRKSQEGIPLNTVDNQFKKTLSNISYSIGYGESVYQYYIKVKSLEGQLPNNEYLQIYLKLCNAYGIEQIEHIVSNSKHSIVKDRLAPMLIKLKSETRIWSRYVPVLTWNGAQNQYHQWLLRTLKGDLGSSYQNEEKVSTLVNKALPWTFSLAFLSLIIALLIATPLAVYSAFSPDKMSSRLFSILFQSLYSIPSFWAATLLILFLGQGGFLNLLPTYGIGEVNEGANLWQSLLNKMNHLILPLVCWSYGSMAYIYNQVKLSMETALKNDYVKTAKAKGISSKRLLWTHVFPNASFPLITLIGGAIPSLISGSFIIESIFGIPGMGKLVLDSFFARDYPVILAVLIMGALLSIIGLLLSDLLYQKVNPSVAFNQHSND